MLDFIYSGLGGAALAVIARMAFGMDISEKRWWWFVIGFSVFAWFVRH